MSLQYQTMTPTATNKHAVSIAVAGAAGRMGQRLVALASESPDLDFICAFERTGHEAIGSDSGQVAGIMPNNVLICDDTNIHGDVVIDFTIPQATRNLLRNCVDKGIAMVIGTTGMSNEDHEAIDDAAKIIPIVQAPNMSLGVNLLCVLSAQVAKQLGDDYDVEILDIHHRYKKDSPSGTAIGLAESICKATHKNPGTDVIYSRQGNETARQRGQVVIQSLRMGDVIGEHSVFYAALGERIELKHVATSRDTFARGALHAAIWLKDKAPGRYDMKDVLGLSINGNGQ